MQNKHTHSRKAYRPALFPERGDNYTEQDWKKQEKKEQGKTQHEMPLGKNHKGIQNKNQARAPVLERSVA